MITVEFKKPSEFRLGVLPTVLAKETRSNQKMSFHLASYLGAPRPKFRKAVRVGRVV
jgi:hypothetical protein